MTARNIKTLFDLTGKRALITGGSRGLGLQIAHSLGEAGATVVLSARKQDELDEAVAELKAAGINASAIAADCGTAEGAMALAAAALKQLGEALMPAALSSATAPSSSSCLRAEITMVAPASPSECAICSPRPREPPVMRARLPVRSNRVLMLRAVMVKSSLESKCTDTRRGSAVVRISCGAAHGGTASVPPYLKAINGQISASQITRTDHRQPRINFR